MAYDTQYIVKDENGTLYLFDGMWNDSDAWILDQATGFYGKYMVSIIGKDRI